MNILIKRGTSTILTVKPQQASTYMRAIMGEETVTLVWEQSTFTALQVGDYIAYNGIKHTLNQLPQVKKVSTNLFQYNAVFQSPMYDLLKVSYMLFDDTGTIPSGDFSLTGTPETFIILLTDNLNRVLSDQWEIGTILTAEAQTLTFSNESCYAVLQKLADTFKTEYSVTGNTVNLIEISTNSNLTLEYGSTLYDIERKTIDSSSVITRLYPFGATRNIAANYRSGSKRLLLPTPLQYLEANTNLYGIIEGQKQFDDVYPRLGATTAGTVTNTTTDCLQFIDSLLDFNVNSYFMPGTSAKLHFISGQCAGYDLEIAAFDNSTKTFKLIANKDDKGVEIPNSTLRPANGDKYVLLDIIMPPSYLTAAEAELQTKAAIYLTENSQPKVSYLVTFSEIYAKINSADMFPGNMVTVHDSDMGINMQLRVVKIQKGVIDPWNMKIDLSDTVSKSTLTRMASDIAANTEGITAANKGISQQFSRNWQNVQELSTMIDTLRADMLFIGNVQGQFSLSSILFTPNYQNDKNKFYATAGSLIHKTIPSETAPGTWILPAYAPTLTGDTTPYYLYAKCSQSAGTGVFYLSATSIMYDSDAAYYYFLIGVLSSVNNGVRTLQTTYGFTQITGKQIATGSIQSADGQTFFNLDTGVIQGNLKFQSGITVESATSAAQSTANSKRRTFTAVPVSPYDVGDIWLQGASGDILNCTNARGLPATYVAGDWAKASKYTDDTAVNNLQIGGRNLLRNSKIANYNNSPGSSGTSQRTINLVSGKTYTLSANVKLDNLSSGVDVYFFLAPDWRFNTSVSFRTELSDTTKSVTFVAPETNTYTLVSYLISGADTTNWFKIEEGNKPTDWTPAPEDVQALFDDIAADNRFTPDEKQAALNAWNIIQGEYTRLSTQATSLGISNTLSTYYTDLANYINPLLSSMTSTSDIDGTTFRTKFASYANAATDLKNALTTKVQTNLDNLQIGGRNLVTDSNNFQNLSKNLIVVGNQSYSDPNNGTKATLVTMHASSYDAFWFFNKMVVGKKYTVSLWVKLATATNFVMTCGDGNSWNTWQTQAQITGAGWQRLTAKFTATTTDLYAHIGGNGSGIQQTNGTAYIYGFQIELGDKATDWTPAPEDIQSQIDASNSLLADIASSNRLTPGDKIQVKREFDSLSSEESELYNQLVELELQEQDAIEQDFSFFSTYIIALLANMTVTSDINGSVFESFFTNWYASRDGYKTLISDTIKAMAQSTNYLKEAMTGSTEITGGLVASNVLLLKALSGAISGGMSGLTADPIGFWTGGTYQNAIDGLAKAIIKKDGSAYFKNAYITGIIEALSGGKIGNFDIVGGSIVGFDTNGYQRIKISTEAIPTVISGLAGSTVYIGGNLDTEISEIISQSGYSTIQIETDVTFNLPFATTLQTYSGQNDCSIEPDSGVTLSYISQHCEFYKNNVLVGQCAANEAITLAVSGTITLKYITSAAFDFSDAQSSALCTLSVSNTHPPSYTDSNAKTMIGNNGFYSYFASTAYVYFNPSTGFEVRLGQFRLQIDSTGIRKSTNGGSTWSNL